MSLQQGYFTGGVSHKIVPQEHMLSFSETSPENSFTQTNNFQFNYVPKDAESKRDSTINKISDNKVTSDYSATTQGSSLSREEVCFAFNRNKMQQVYTPTGKCRLVKEKHDYSPMALNKRHTALNYSYNFGMVKDVSGCGASLEKPEVVFSKTNSNLVAPPSMTGLHEIDTLTPILSTNRQIQGLTSTPTIITVQKTKTDQTTSTNKTKMDTDRDSIESQTGLASSQQTENTILSTEVLNMLYSIHQHITTVKSDVAVIKEEIDCKINKMDTEIMNTINIMDTKVNNKLDGMNVKLSDLGTDIDIFRHEVTDLKTEVTQNKHQVELLENKVLANTAEILEIKQDNKKIVEVMNESHLTWNDKYSLLKGEVNHTMGNMSIDLQQAKLDLEQLRGNILKLEGAINENRGQNSQLNDAFLGIKSNMLQVMPMNSEPVKTLLSLKSPWPSTTPNQLRLDANAAPSNTQMPSITSSPLVSQSFSIPQAIINQQAQSQLPPRYLNEEDTIVKAMMKKEKTPSFDGANVSAPQFIEEAEAYFRKVNITSDHNKVKIVGSFFKDVAFLWWRRVEKEITTWDQAKKEIMEQYFNDYNRRRFKQEWREYEYDKVKDVEVFTLRAFHLLDIVKPNYPFKKKCQTVASRLPALLMTYLLQKEFQNEKEFMNTLKEAMILTNFKPNSNTSLTPNLSLGQGTSSNSNNGTWYNGNNNNNNGNQNNSGWNNTNNQNNSNHGGNIITNPNYKGRPVNFIPNFRPMNRNNYGNNSNGNNFNYNNFNGNSRQGQGNGFSSSPNNNRRNWYNRSNSRNGRRPYNSQQNGYNGQGNNGSGSTGGQQTAPNPPQGVNNVNMAQIQNPPSIPVPQVVQTQPNPAINLTTGVSPGYVLVPSTSPIFQTIMDASLNTAPSSSMDGQNASGSDPTN